MAQLQSRHASPATSGFSNGSSQPLDLEIPDFQQPPLIQGKEAATLDLLSLYGNGSTSSSSVTCATTGLAPPLVATQDLLQPLEIGIKPTSSGLLSHGLVVGRGALHTNNMDHYASQQTSYALVNGTLEISSNASYHVNNGEGISEGMRERLEKLAHWSSIQSRLRSGDINYVSKGQGISLMSKNWQQQPVGLQLLDASERPPRAPSEDDEDEDDESFDHGDNAKKERLQQKCDALQKLEGKMSDKGITSRSKHSATEQRRRSKINDRFQMLRQLLPKVDQKRDKASFLMEVIEYIQILQEKVQKYEAVEYGRHQERYKRSSLYQDSIANASYVSSVSTTAFDTKEVLDSNGYMRSRSSPLASGCEEAFGPPLISSMGQASVLQNKLSQGPQACPSGHENKCVLSKPISLSFSSQPCAVSSLERISVPQPMSESRTVPDQLLYHGEEHAGIVEKDLMYSNAESIIASLQSQPNNNKSMPVSLNHVINRDHEKAKVSELSLGSRRSSQILDMHRDEVSNSLNRLAAEQQSEVQPCEQEAFAVQGDVINVSSIYSQGLLDTLTQALQSSGVDMNQAAISVQIDLGKPGGRAAASNWPKAATLSTGLSESQSRETGSSSDSELQRKKPKIEIDV